MNLTLIPSRASGVASPARGQTHLALFLAGWLRLLFGLSMLIVLAGSSLAQVPGIQNYTALCDRLYAAKDYLSARGQCQLATTDNPRDARAWQLLTASTLALGNYAEATQALGQAQTLAPAQDETRLLAAELAFAQNDFEAALSSADTVQQNSQRKLNVRARSLDRLERREEAIEAYRQVLSIFPTDNAARVALSERLLVQDPQEALEVIERGTGNDTEMLAQRGYLQWATGNGKAAIVTLEDALERASRTPRSLSDEGRIKALTALSMAYFGSGELGQGNLALAQLNSTYNVIGRLLDVLFPYLLPLLVLLLLHLFGESRIEPLSTLEFDEGQQPWTVASLYRILLISLFGGLLVGMVYGSAMYSNLLSLWTPLQSNEVLPLFYATLAALAFGLSWQSLRGRGWRPREVLFPPTSAQTVSLGLLAGAAWALLTVVYANLTRTLAAPWNGYFLPLELPSLWLFLALLLLPLTEPFFRAYAFVPLERRYGRPIAVGILICLYSLVFALPLPLMLLEAALLVGLALYKNRGGHAPQPPMVMRYALYGGLALVAFALPEVRVWF